MNRRRALAALASLAVGAGCTENARAPSGPRNPPIGGEEGPSEEERAALYVASYDFAEGDDGNLVAPVTVGNRADEDRDGRVVAKATAQDDDYTETVDVTVPASSEMNLTVGFDLPFDEFARDGTLEVSVSER